MKITRLERASLSAKNGEVRLDFQLDGKRSWFTFTGTDVDALKQIAELAIAQRRPS